MSTVGNKKKKKRTEIFLSAEKPRSPVYLWLGDTGEWGDSSGYVGVKDGKGSSHWGWAQSPRSKSCWGPEMDPAVRIPHRAFERGQPRRASRFLVAISSLPGLAVPSGTQSSVLELRRPFSCLWPSFEVVAVVAVSNLGTNGSVFSKACGTAGASFLSPSEGRSPWWVLLHPPCCGQGALRAACPAAGTLGTARGLWNVVVERTRESG